MESVGSPKLQKGLPKRPSYDLTSSRRFCSIFTDTWFDPALINITIFICSSPNKVLSLYWRQTVAAGNISRPNWP